MVRSNAIVARRRPRARRGRVFHGTRSSNAGRRFVPRRDLARVVPIPMRQPGMPALQTAHLKYCKGVDLNPTLGNIAVLQFRANSIVEPQGSTAPQPTGFDEWASFYNHYIVLGAKINVSVVDAADFSSPDAPVVMGVALNPNNVSLGSYAEYISNGRCSYALQQQRGGGNEKQFSLSYDARTFFNCPNPLDRLETLGAGIQANPTELAYFDLFMQIHDGVTTPAAGHFLVTIDYYVAFSERKLLPTSAP